MHYAFACCLQMKGEKYCIIAGKTLHTRLTDRTQISMLMAKFK